MIWRGMCALLAAGALCGLPACGSDDGADDTSNAASGDAPATTDGSVDSVGLADRVVRVKISEPVSSQIWIEAPAKVRAGLVDIELENQAKSRIHDAQLFKVDGKQSAADIASFVEEVDYQAKPDWLHPVGGVAPVPPGGKATVTQVLQPGTYYITDTQERDDEISNAIRGAVKKLTVTGSADAALPRTSARITARDGGFEVAGLEAGTQHVTFRNAGPEFHQVVAFPISDEISLGKAKKDLVQQNHRWMPVDVEGSRATTVLEAGGEQVTTLTLRPGRYLLACFAEDRKGGPPHSEVDRPTELVVR
jgi:hypothetical protein